MTRQWRRRARRPSPSRPARGVVLRLESLEERAVPALSVSNLTSPSAANTLVQELVGGGVAISNIKFTGATGDNASAGTFTGGNGIIGFDQGIILSNGFAKNVIGPNNTESASGDLGLPGDPDLDKIVAPNTTNDATVLEFDFVPTGSTVSFQYVFGSEEYPEFAPPNNSPFNDVFAFFLNGKNVALLPGTNTPVSINTVNRVTNQQFYVDNDPNNDATGAPLDTQLDGLTTVLTVQAAVTPGVSNHIKLAIADTSDHIYDSDVFIKAGSFSSPAKPVAYHPFRYIFNATTQTFDGNVTVINLGQQPLAGPITIDFPSFPTQPPGVTLTNPNTTVGGGGFSGLPGAPGIVSPVAALPGKTPVLRVEVQLSDPDYVPLSTFFLGFGIDIEAGTSSTGMTTTGSGAPAGSLVGPSQLIVHHGPRGG